MPDDDVPTPPSLASRVAGIERALAHAGLNARPVAVLDLDAFTRNATAMAERAGGTPIRVASKSLRVRRALEHALRQPGYAGVLAFTLPEALWLASHGYRDIVVGYPTADRAALAALAADDEARAAITLMVDSPDQLDLADAAAPGHQPLRIALELDAAYSPRLPGGRGPRFGALRSPLATPMAVAGLARHALRRGGFEVVGLMAYEAQIAGVGDAGRSARAAVIRAMRKASATELAERRARTVELVSQAADLEFVNGGGTGSLETTSREPAVTEVAAGSGLIGPALFDGYTSFRPEPALLLGFDAVRRPRPGVVTILGGGWAASGAPGADRLPAVAWPEGLTYAPDEGAGEVQTPLRGSAADALDVGHTVWLRHAKAGEPAERVNSYAVVAGGEVIQEWPTYRGEGKAFL